MKAFDSVNRVRARCRRATVLGAALCAALFASGGCAIEPEAEPAAQREAREVREAGRLFVLQHRGAELEVLSSQVLSHAPRPPRGAHAAWRGRFEVVDDRGQVLEEGAFRLPHRIHALFAAIDGPAEPVSVPDDAPVFWVRTPTPPGAATLRLFHRDAARGVTAIGELPL